MNFLTKYKKEWKEAVKKVRLGAIYIENNESLLNFLDESEFLKITVFRYDEFKMVIKWNEKYINVFKKNDNTWHMCEEDVWNWSTPRVFFGLKNEPPCINQLFSSIFTDEMIHEGVEFLREFTTEAIKKSKVKKVEVEGTEITIEFENGLVIEQKGIKHLVEEAAKLIK